MSCYGEYVDGVNVTSKVTGYQNTMDIVNQVCATANKGLTVKATLNSK